MVTIKVDGDALDIQVEGSHRFWAMRSSLRVPLTDVRDVRRDPERAKRFFPGFKVPGTHIPFVFTAGTYYQTDFRPDFWDVRNADQAIVIRCSHDGEWDEIIVEVEDPDGTVALIRNAIPNRAY